MPRVADHDERRAQIARAFQRLLAAEGFARVSFTRVAAEAGISVGLIQHYFPGKRVLLRFAYDDVLERTSARVRDRVREGRDAHRPVARILLDSLVELLPLDQERTVEYRVRQSLQSQAPHDVELFEVAHRAGGALLDAVSATIRSGVDSGEVDPALDPRLAARTILATVQGTADQLALSGPDAFPAHQVLGPVVELVFGGPGRRATA